MLNSRTALKLIATSFIAFQLFTTAQSGPAKAYPAQAKPAQTDGSKDDPTKTAAAPQSAIAQPTQPAAPAKQDCCPECNCDMPMIDPDH